MRSPLLDIVVPSAKDVDLLEHTLPALARACERAKISPANVVVADDRPERGSFKVLVDRLGFRLISTRGIGNGPARNAAARIGDAPLLLFVDDDVELDEDAVVTAMEAVCEHNSNNPIAVMGGLRPPPGSPDWLRWAYADATVNPASAAAGRALLPCTQIAVTFLLIERSTFERVGGFPELSVWGWIDALFGLRLQAEFGRRACVLREPALGGVHWYQPTWDEWLERMEHAGQRLSEVVAPLSAEDRDQLLGDCSLARKPRHVVKRGLGRLPASLTARGRGRIGRKAAAAAALARGFRRGSSRT